MNKHLTALYLCCLAAVVSVSCQKLGAVELDERAVVIAMGISPGENGRYKADLSFPIASGIVGKGGGEKTEVQTGEGERLQDCFDTIGLLTGREPYSGHLKAIVFSTEILYDSVLLTDALDELIFEMCIDTNVVICAAGEKTADILASEPSGEPLAGVFLENYFKKEKELRTTLGGLYKALLTDGRAKIPVISLTDPSENGRREPWINGTAEVIYKLNEYNKYIPLKSGDTFFKKFGRSTYFYTDEEWYQKKVRARQKADRGFSACRHGRGRVRFHGLRRLFEQHTGRHFRRGHTAAYTGEHTR